MLKVENVFMSNFDFVFCIVLDVFIVVVNFVRAGERGFFLRFFFLDDIFVYLVFNFSNVVKFMLYLFFVYFFGGICKLLFCCNGFCNDLIVWSCFLLSF